MNAPKVPWTRRTPRVISNWTEKKQPTRPQLYTNNYWEWRKAGCGRGGLSQGGMCVPCSVNVGETHFYFLDKIPSLKLYLLPILQVIPSVSHSNQTVDTLQSILGGKSWGVCIKCLGRLWELGTGFWEHRSPANMFLCDETWRDRLMAMGFSSSGFLRHLSLIRKQGWMSGPCALEASLVQSSRSLVFLSFMGTGMKGTLEIAQQLVNWQVFHEHPRGTLHSWGLLW